MADLQVDAAALLAASARVVTGSSRLRRVAASAAPDGSILGAPAVAEALRDGSAQLTVRAQVTADALHRSGSAPAAAARTFVAADTGLARAF